MSIKQICESITKLFTNALPPFPQLPRILLVCSLIKRQGLSAIRSTSNIVKDLNKLGIPTGPMPDGSPNLTVAFAFASTKENFRALKKDASVQVGVQPGSMMITGFGANAGGPVNIQGVNTSPSIAVGAVV